MLGGYTPENSTLTTAGNFKSMGSEVEGRKPDDKDSLWCNYCHNQNIHVNLAGNSMASLS